MAIDYICRKVICPNGGNLYPMQFAKTYLPSGELFIYTNGCEFYHFPGICNECRDKCCKIVKTATENSEMTPNPIDTHLFYRGC